MKNFPLMFAHDGKTNKIIGKKKEFQHTKNFMII